MFISDLQRNKKADALYFLKEKLWKFIELKSQISTRFISICTSLSSNFAI